MKQIDTYYKKKGSFTIICEIASKLSYKASQIKENNKLSYIDIR